MYAHVGPDLALFTRSLLSGRAPLLETAIERAVQLRADELEGATSVELVIEVNPEARAAFTAAVKRAAAALAEQAVRRAVGSVRPALRVYTQEAIDDSDDIAVRLTIDSRRVAAPARDGRTIVQPSQPSVGDDRDEFRAGAFVLQFSVVGPYGLACHSLHALAHPDVVLGRRVDGIVAENIAILLPTADDSISRHHLELRFLKGGNFAEWDMTVKGRNGVTVKGALVAAGRSARIALGERIELGARQRLRQASITLLPADDAAMEAS